MRIHRYCTAFLLFIPLGFIASCTVGPDFERPATPAITSYESVPVPLAVPGDLDPA